MSSPSFKPNHMVLILDAEKHQHLKDAVDEALWGTTGRHLISVLYYQNHQSLLVSYKIKKYPTLLIFNSYVDEITRISDEDLLTVPFFRNALNLMGADETSV